MTPDVPVEARPPRAIRGKGITSFQELLSIARQMKVLRASKMPWLRILGRLARGLGRLIKTAAMLGMLGGDRRALVVSGLFYRVACKYPRRFRLQLRGQ